MGYESQAGRGGKVEIKDETALVNFVGTLQKAHDLQSFSLVAFPNKYILLSSAILHNFIPFFPRTNIWWSRDPLHKGCAFLVTPILPL